MSKPVMLKLINDEWECLNPDCEHDGECCGPAGEHHNFECPCIEAEDDYGQIETGNTKACLSCRIAGEHDENCRYCTAELEILRRERAEWAEKYYALRVSLEAVPEPDEVTALVEALEAQLEQQNNLVVLGEWAAEDRNYKTSAQLQRKIDAANAHARDLIAAYRRRQEARS